MSESTHTPGPWKEGISSGAIVAERCPVGDPRACDKCHEGSDAFYGGHMVCESAHPMDRHLIAAAPDLLAALEKIAYAPIGEPEASAAQVLAGCVELARVALAKARA